MTPRDPEPAPTPAELLSQAFAGLCAGLIAAAWLEALIDRLEGAR